MRVSELDKIKLYQLEIDHLRTYMLSSMRKAIDVLITSELLRAAARERALVSLDHEDSKNCTQILPGMHRKLGEWWSSSVGWHHLALSTVSAIRCLPARTLGLRTLPCLTATRVRRTLENLLLKMPTSCQAQSNPYTENLILIFCEQNTWINER